MLGVTRHQFALQRGLVGGALFLQEVDEAELETRADRDAHRHGDQDAGRENREKEFGRDAGFHGRPGGDGSARPDRVRRIDGLNGVIGLIGVFDSIAAIFPEADSKRRIEEANSHFLQFSRLFPALLFRMIHPRRIAAAGSQRVVPQLLSA
ncbi:hypothetical protein G3N97_34000 [Paraburkholderia sp. Ac-20347]|nr:hypothetical protein [Paraburkholderia sp. Ac-20347]